MEFGGNNVSMLTLLFLVVGFHVVLILSGPTIVCANFVIEYSKQIHFQVTTLLTFENG
jgi:hypothetical protein